MLEESNLFCYLKSKLTSEGHHIIQTPLPKGMLFHPERCTKDILLRIKMQEIPSSSTSHPARPEPGSARPASTC